MASTLIHSSALYSSLPSHTQFIQKHPKFRGISRGRFNSTFSASNHTNVSLFEAAKHTVDTYVQSGMVVGLGSGSGSFLATQYLGQKLRLGILKDVVGIPTSVGSASEAAKAGIPLNLYEDGSKIDFAFNDADMVEEGTLTAVIGRRSLHEDSMIEEKKVLQVTENLVLMITEKGYKRAVEGSIPVLVKSVSWMDTAEEIDDLFVGDAEVWRRPAIGHADPTGGDFPLVTREGHNVLDIIFTSPVQDLAEVAELLNKLEGVAGHGIITKTPCTTIITTESGLRIVDSTI